MTWVRLDDQFSIHRKIAGLSDSAYRLHVDALCWSARNLADGIVAKSDLPLICPRMRTPYKYAAELVLREIWHLADEPCDAPKCPAPIDGQGWRIHDYFEFQFSKEQIAGKRKRNARRQALFRDAGLKKTIRFRDDDDCRYCGITVRWGAGQASDSGTFDHIDPDGENVIENIVVACNACNARKMDRLPAQAGMTLLPEPTRKASRKASTNAWGEALPTRPVPYSSIGSSQRAGPGYPQPATNGSSSSFNGAASRQPPPFAEAQERALHPELRGRHARKDTDG